jgi:hypothetical protein
MIEILDFKAINADSSDPRELNALLRQLLGQPFLFFRVSYGDELTIHLGESLEYGHLRMKGHRKGSYILAARASNWYFRPNMQPRMFVGANDLNPDVSSVAQRVEIREIEWRPLVEPGSVVAKMDVVPIAGGFILVLILSDRSTLMIEPSQPATADESSEEDPIADWELFTPHGRYLRVGPGDHWAYLASDGSTEAQK